MGLLIAVAAVCVVGLAAELLVLMALAVVELKNYVR